MLMLRLLAFAEITSAALPDSRRWVVERWSAVASLMSSA
jgi:hypothetical protein